MERVVEIDGDIQNAPDCFLSVLSNYIVRFEINIPHGSKMYEIFRIYLKTPDIYDNAIITNDKQLLGYTYNQHNDHPKYDMYRQMIGVDNMLITEITDPTVEVVRYFPLNFIYDSLNNVSQYETLVVFSCFKTELKDIKKYKLYVEYIITEL